MNCPICGKHVEPLPTTFDGEGFRCDTCGDYGISGSVLKVGKSLDQTAGVKHCGMPKGKQNRESCQRSLLTLSETYHRAGAYPRAQIAEACGFRSYLFGLGTKNNVSIREDVLKDHPVLRQ